MTTTETLSRVKQIEQVLKSDLITKLIVVRGIGWEETLEAREKIIRLRIDLQNQAEQEV